MKQSYTTFKFFIACVLIFGSGYLVAKPRSEADKIFAPLICGLAVYSLWRSRRPQGPLALS